MPRALKVDLPGVPRIRALCSDSLGLIKVIETEGELGAPKVVARWGDPDPQQGVICMSLSNDTFPSLAVARKSSTVDVIDPGSGRLESRLIVPKSVADVASNREASDLVGGLHLFGQNSPWGRAVLTYTGLGDAVLQGLPELDEEQHPKSEKVLSRWDVSQTGSVLCMAVDATEQYAVFGGKGVDVNVWDIKKGSRIWSAKAPHRDNLGLMSPAWVTAVTFLTEDHRKVVVGTGHHQVRLYDLSSQRRPVLAFDYGEAPIRTLTKDPDGFSVYVGTGGGDLACFDMRTGKLVGGFKGKCAGSIRSVVRHPVLPLIASCGLDRYLRIHSTKTRQLLGSLFLKQQLVSVLFHVTEDKSTTAVTSSQDTAAVQPMTMESTTLNVNGSDKSALKKQAVGSEEILSLSGVNAGRKVKSNLQSGDAEDGRTLSSTKNTTKSKKNRQAEEAPFENREEEIEEPPVTNEEQGKKKNPNRSSEGIKAVNGEAPTDEDQVPNREKVKKKKKLKREASFVNGGAGREEGLVTSGEKSLTRSKSRSQAEDIGHRNGRNRSRVQSSKKARTEGRKVLEEV